MHKLTLTADLGYRLSPADVQALSVSAGAEYAWRELVMLRGGYHCGDKKKGDASYATAGAGVEYAGVRLDFCMAVCRHEWPCPKYVLGVFRILFLSYPFHS